MHLGLLGALGMAFSVILGGLFNLLGVISPLLLRLYLLVGIFLFGTLVYSRRQGLYESFSQTIKLLSGNRILVVGTVLVAVLLLLNLFHVKSSLLNSHDDFHAYLVFPLKMLKTGSMGEDPFNHRRLTASLGGQSFLLALMLGLVRPAELNCLELGLAYLAAMGVLFSHTSKRQLPAVWSVALALLLLIVKIPMVNTTSVVTGLVLFYSMLLIFVLEEKSISLSGQAFLLALVVAGLCSLKNSHIPGCALILVSSYFFVRRVTLAKMVIVALAVGALALVFMLPWMIALKQSSGTFLYPLLGKGFDVSTYGGSITFISDWSLLKIAKQGVMLLAEPVFISSVVLLIYVIGCWHASRELRSGIAVMTASVVATLLLVYLSDGEIRFAFSFLFASFIYLTVESLSMAPGTLKDLNWWRSPAIGAVIAISLLFGVHWRGELSWRIHQVMRARTLLTTSVRSLRSGFDPGEVLALQAAIPPGEPLLARLSKPFLLDFTRNPIYTIDWPCAASPPPGLPCFSGPKLLAEYLCSRSIRYIAFSYSEEAGFPRSLARSRLKHENNFWRTSAEYTIAFHDILLEMVTQYATIYDDGKNFVLDLDCAEIEEQPVKKKIDLK